MVDRQEVGMMLEASQNAIGLMNVLPGDPRIAVDAPILAALCRAWLALDAGQVETVREAIFVDGHSVGKLVVTTGQSMIGQRVRIVKEAGDA